MPPKPDFIMPTDEEDAVINRGIAGDLDTLPDAAWVCCSAGRGTRGERLYAWLYCPMADLEAAEYFDMLTGP